MNEWDRRTQVLCCSSVLFFILKKQGFSKMAGYEIIKEKGARKKRVVQSERTD